MLITTYTLYYLISLLGVPVYLVSRSSKVKLVGIVLLLFPIVNMSFTSIPIILGNAFGLAEATIGRSGALAAIGLLIVLSPLLFIINPDNEKLEWLCGLTIILTYLIIQILAKVESGRYNSP